MGLMDILKSAGLTEDVPEEGDERPPPAQRGKTEIPLPSTLPAVPAAVAPRAQDPARAKAILDRMRQELEPVLAASKFQTEIGNTVAALSDTIPDENSRLRAAIKLITLKGPTVVDLIGDVDSCIGLLQKKGRDFNAGLDGEVERKVGSKRQRKKEVQDQMAAKRAEIQAAQQEIARLESDLSRCDSEIVDEQHVIDEIRSVFNHVYREVENDLETRKARLSAIPKGGS